VYTFLPETDSGVCVCVCARARVCACVFTFLPHGRFSTAMGSAPFFVPCTCHAPPSELMLELHTPTSYRLRFARFRRKDSHDAPVHSCRCGLGEDRGSGDAQHTQTPRRSNALLRHLALLPLPPSPRLSPPHSFSAPTRLGLCCACVSSARRFGPSLFLIRLRSRMSRRAAQRPLFQPRSRPHERWSLERCKFAQRPSLPSMRRLCIALRSMCLCTRTRTHTHTQHTHTTHTHIHTHSHTHTHTRDRQERDTYTVRVLDQACSARFMSWPSDQELLYPLTATLDRWGAEGREGVGGQPQHPRPRRHAGHHDPPHVAALICLSAASMWVRRLLRAGGPGIRTSGHCVTEGQAWSGVWCLLPWVPRHCCASEPSGSATRACCTYRPTFIRCFACKSNPSSPPKRPDDRHGVTERDGDEEGAVTHGA